MYHRIMWDILVPELEHIEIIQCLVVNERG